MGKSRFVAVTDIRLGAVWRFALKRALPREAVAGLLADRCGMAAKQADQLSGHWFSHSAFRAKANL
jgi:hypothetical protein